jgi:uncharacterized protein (TIGR03437 family)
LNVRRAYRHIATWPTNFFCDRAPSLSSIFNLIMSKSFSTQIRPRSIGVLIGLPILFVALALLISFRLDQLQDKNEIFQGRITDRRNDQQEPEFLGKLPLRFEINQGQVDEAVRFISRGQGYKLYFTRNEIVVDLDKAKRKGSEAVAAPRLALRLVDSRTDSQISGLERLPGTSNYFIGNDPREWRIDIPNYARVLYQGVYSGIDLVYYGNQRRLEYDFVVAPHADPAAINLKLEGAGQLRIDEKGDVLVALGGEELRMRKPFVYQDVNGERRGIAGSYRINERNLICFEIGDYDPNYRLTIDPILDYSTYLGNGGTDIGYGIAVDPNGNIYVTGQTSSPNFPVKNPFDNTLDGASDAFVIKLNPSGSSLVYATYIGGRNPGDKGWAIAVDKAGNAYFTGETNSLNFPVVNAVQPTLRGNGDAFVAKLNIEGNVLLYSTYLGGSFFDAAYSITLDNFDNAYLTGRTDSNNFPTKNALQPQIRGLRDVFVTRLDADGAIVYSTYIGGEPAVAGGRDEETGLGIAIDLLQNVYVTGLTNSPSFPTVNAIRPDFGGVEDAFVTKINSTNSAILYSTFLGGSRVDNGRGIAVDTFGNAYVTGYTVSLDFPQVNPLQPGFGGNIDGFVVKLNASGNELIYSTYFGGSGAENNGLASENIAGGAIAVDNFGNAYITGKTESPNLPMVRAIQGTFRGNNDAFIAKIDPAGSGLIFSTFLGSTFIDDTGFEERGLGITVDNSGGIYVTGQVLKNDFPIINAAQKEYGGGLSDGFIVKISTSDITTIAPVSAASFYGAALSAESIVAAFGSNLAGGTETAVGLPLPTTLLGTSITVKDKNGVEHLAPLFFVSPNQINFQFPVGVPNGRAVITVANGQNTSLSTTTLVNSVAPALFSANANGQGVPAALVLRVTADGSSSFEPVAELNNLGRFVPLPIDLGPETDQVFLVLFGTGFRNHTSLSNVSAQIGRIDVPVLYAGPQGSFVGEDQINLRVPRSLAGRGETILTLLVDGMIANPVSINIR